MVVLWRVASCSSAPWLGADDMDGDPAGDSSDPPDIKASEQQPIQMQFNADE